jgi:hypothetical protein
MIKIVFFPLSASSFYAFSLYQDHFFVTCKNIISEFMILDLIAPLMDVGVQFHSCVPEEWQCNRAYRSTASLARHHTATC